MTRRTRRVLSGSRGNRAGRRMVSQSGRTALSGVHQPFDSDVRAVAAGFGGMAGRVEEDEPRMMRAVGCLGATKPASRDVQLDLIRLIVIDDAQQRASGSGRH